MPEMLENCPASGLIYYSLQVWLFVLFFLFCFALLSFLARFLHSLSDIRVGPEIITDPAFLVTRSDEFAFKMKSELVSL